MDNNYIADANKEVCRVAEIEYLKAERLRWIAEIVGNGAEMELQEEIARRWESINRLVAPPDWYFVGFNKFPAMTTVPAQVRELKAAMNDDPVYSLHHHRSALEEHIAKLEASEVGEQMVSAPHRTGNIREHTDGGSDLHDGIVKMGRQYL